MTAEEIKWESNIRDLFSNLFFIDSLPSGTIRGPSGGFQVDVTGGSDNTYIIIDATISKDPINKISDKKEFKKRARKIKNFINYHHPGKYNQFKFVVWTKSKGINENTRKYFLRANVELLEYRTYKKLKSRINTINKQRGANRAPLTILRYLLLRQLKIRLPLIPDINLNKIPAIKFLFYKNTFAYNFVVSPYILLRTCYVMQRESEGKRGFQRLLNEDRINEIKDYIEKNKTSFPNNIIVNYEDKNFRIKETKCVPTQDKNVFNCIIQLPDIYYTASIIDGQHRVYGFMDVNENFQKKFQMDVIAFNNLSKRESAHIFIDLNEHQKKIDSSLFWELVGDFYKSSLEGCISNIVRELNRSGVFKDRIWVPSLTEKDTMTIDLANFCKGIKDRSLIHGLYSTKKYLKESRNEYIWNLCYRYDLKRKNIGKKTVQQIDRFFGAAEDSFPLIWRDMFLFTNQGVNIMLRIFAVTLQTYSSPNSPTKEWYKKKIITLLMPYLKKKNKRSYIKSLIRRSSESGRGDIAKEFIKAMNDKRHTFGIHFLRESELHELQSDLVDLKVKNKRIKKYKGIVELLKFLKRFDDEKRWLKKMLNEFPKNKYAKNRINTLKEIAKNKH